MGSKLNTESFARFEADFNKYQAHTHQIFVIERSESLDKENKHFDKLRYKKVTFACVRHKSYVAKDAGEGIFPM